MTRRLAAKLRLRHVMHDDTGAAAVEFVLIAPVILLLLAGIFEIGMVIRAKLDLTSVVSAAANHTLSVGNTIDDASANNVSASLVGLLQGGNRSGTVNVNNAVTARLKDGNVTVTGTGPNISSCYCATRTGEQIVWGSAVACGAVCADASVSGRFVEITATAPFTQLLGMYGFFRDDTVQNTAMVRLP